MKTTNRKSSQLRSLTVLIYLLSAIFAGSIVVLACDAKQNGLETEKKSSGTSIPLSIYKDISFVTAGDSNRQKLDLYIPPASKPLPLLIYIHGGGWLFGDKGAVEPWPYVCKGFAVASINYRFSTEAPFPAQIQDVRTAVRWLKENSSEYNLDPSKFIAFGESAGGHLAALLAASEGNDGDKKGRTNSSEILGAIDFSGPTNLVTMPNQCRSNKQQRMYLPGGFVYSFIGGLLDERMSVAVAASPINHVSKASRPILIVHGEDDDVIPVQQSIEFAKKLESLGAQYKLIIKPGMGHLLRDRESIASALEFIQILCSNNSI